MNARELARIGVEMRTAQNAYFRTRTDEALARSREWERRFDRACHEALAQPGLFDREEVRVQ